MISYDERLIHSDIARAHGLGDRALALIRCCSSYFDRRVNVDVLCFRTSAIISI